MNIQGLLGNASEENVETTQKRLADVLLNNESVIVAFKVIRDEFVFTNRRLLLIDRQGLTGKKTEFKSIPYHAISSFSVENAGTFDMDCDLKIWIGSNPTPIEKSLKRGSDIKGLQKALVSFVSK